MSGKQIHCVISTPEITAFDGNIQQCVLPAFDGEWMIDIDHASMVVLLGAGSLRMKSNDKWLHFYVNSGIAHIKQNKISVVTPSAIDATKLSKEKLEQELTKLQQKTSENKQEREQVANSIKDVKGKLTTLQKMTA